MACNNTSGNPAPAGFTLPELLVASGLASVLLLAVISISFFSSRSFAALANYIGLDQQSRLALDKMSRDIRQVSGLTNYTATSLAFTNPDGSALNYVYNPNSRTLVCVNNNRTNTYLTQCDYLNFGIYQRTPIQGTFDCFPVANVTDTKLVQVTWICSRTILGAKVNTESVQSAKIVIRKHN